MSALPRSRDIEITDEMIVAGVDVLSEILLDLRDGMVSLSQAAQDVYRAMRKALPVED
jgi:hypothetical protein